MLPNQDKTMKSKMSMTALLGIAAAVAGFVTACGKSDSGSGASSATQPDSGATGVSQNLSTAAKTTLDQAAKVAAEHKAEVQQAVSNVAASAQTAASEASSQAQTLIAQATSLISEKKFQDASQILQQLATLKLTPEQQKLVDDLKAKIQAGLAASGLQNVLGGKK